MVTEEREVIANTIDGMSRLRTSLANMLCRYIDDNVSEKQMVSRLSIEVDRLAVLLDGLGSWADKEEVTNG